MDFFEMRERLHLMVVALFITFADESVPLHTAFNQH